eukprot:g5338.t1
MNAMRAQRRRHSWRQSKLIEEASAPPVDLEAEAAKQREADALVTSQPFPWLAVVSFIGVIIGYNAIGNLARDNPYFVPTCNVIMLLVVIYGGFRFMKT